MSLFRKKRHDKLISKLTDEIPLSSAVVIGLIVANAWEIKPFRMSKFIANKIQISLTAKTVRNESVFVRR